MEESADLQVGQRLHALVVALNDPDLVGADALGLKLLDGLADQLFSLHEDANRLDAVDQEVAG
jgi:hypothetical protein